RGSNRHVHPLNPPGEWARHVGKVVRVILGGPLMPRIAASTCGATATIPIIMVTINYDPLALGFIDSIPPPGGNVTGLFFHHLELLAKRCGLFREMLPTAKRIAIFSDALAADQLKQVQMSNQSIGFELQPVHLENPPYDFDNAFQIAMRSQAE